MDDLTAGLVAPEPQTQPAPQPMPVPVLTRRPRGLMLADPREPIAGIDNIEKLPEEQRAVPFWEIADLHDLAALLSGKAMLRAELVAQIDHLMDMVGYLDLREGQLLRKYEHLAEKPENLKTGWKETKIANGAGGKFRWQSKVPPLTVVDEDKAIAAGIASRTTKTVEVTTFKFDTKAAREYIEKHGGAPGVQIGATPCPFSYKPREVAVAKSEPTPAAEPIQEAAA